MKLKFLFVPLSILISMVLIIWYIWPTWFGEAGIREYQKRIDIKKCELEEADFKVRSAESLKNFINSPEGKNSADKIYSYFPLEEKKESIINNINYIGDSSSVSIINIGVESEESKDGDVQILTSANDVANKKVASVSVARECLNNVAEKYGEAANMNIDYLDPFSGLDGATGDVVKETEDKVENATEIIKANVSVAGSYKQLIVFLDNLYRMKAISNITSINIHRDSSNNQNAEGATAPSEDFLLMDASIYFGYLPKDKNTTLGFDDPIFEKKSFDLTAVNKLAKIVEIPEISITETGKDNPFLP